MSGRRAAIKRYLSMTFGGRFSGRVVEMPGGRALVSA
jgi:hypothetical protein